MGIKGGTRPIWDESKCIFCGLCQAVCPAQKISVDKKARNFSVNRDKCIHCGKCIKNGPAVLKGKEGFIVSFAS